MSEESKSQAPGSINVGNISGATGVAIGHGSQASVVQSGGATRDEIAEALAKVLQKVNAMPDGPNKTMAQTAMQGLEAEAQKGEQAAEGTVSQWFNFLAQTAPDALEVAIDTFINPIKGLGTAFKKIAERAKAERAEKK